MQTPLPKAGTPLAAWNQCWRRIDELYHQYAKRHGISETTLWILYALQEQSVCPTQSELCMSWCYPPQTLNSALKAMERQGLLQLEGIAGRKKGKGVRLTEKGRALSDEVILPLFAAEQAALEALPTAERDAMLHLTQKHVALLADALREPAGPKPAR